MTNEVFRISRAGRTKYTAFLGYARSLGREIAETCEYDPFQWWFRMTDDQRRFRIEPDGDDYVVVVHEAMP